MKPEELLRSKAFILTKIYPELDNLNPIMFSAKHGITSYISNNLSCMTGEQIAEMMAMTTNAGLTALHFAARYGRIDTTKLLLQLGASPLAPTKLGYLPIHMIFNDKNDNPTIETLFELFSGTKECIDVKTSNNETVAHFAASKGLVKILEYLQAHYPQQFNRKNNESMTPLMDAVMHNQIDACIYLSKNSNTKLTNSKGQNPLHIAAGQASKDTMLAILPFFNVNSLDNEKHFPIYYATLVNDQDKISELRAHGAEQDYIHKV